MERFRMALSRLKAEISNSLGIKGEDKTRLDMANRKRQIERSLRDSGLSRSEAKRITGVLIRHI